MQLKLIQLLCLDLHGQIWYCFLKELISLPQPNFSDTPGSPKLKSVILCKKVT